MPLFFICFQEEEVDFDFVKEKDDIEDLGYVDIENEDEIAEKEAPMKKAMNRSEIEENIEHLYELKQQRIVSLCLYRAIKNGLI